MRRSPLVGQILVSVARPLARARRNPAAVTDLGAALVAWRGPAYADVTGSAWAQRERTRLEELRLEGVELRAHILLDSGEDRSRRRTGCRRLPPHPVTARRGVVAASGLLRGFGPRRATLHRLAAAAAGRSLRQRCGGRMSGARPGVGAGAVGAAPPLAPPLASIGPAFMGGRSRLPGRAFDVEGVSAGRLSLSVAPRCGVDGVEVQCQLEVVVVLAGGHHDQDR
ncbi:BTAD domain-containing putative transcriptional regulator [Streptomyces sp. NPDC090119]|uniref:BTAD domain-containing putative transcriptional regulator n=1 Tax=Streptomyces sp. NPDC090119 TaxID=3365951 RepID=UPI0037FC6570